MSGYQRTPLFPVHPRIASAYQPGSKGGGTGGPRSTLLSVRKMGGSTCMVPQDVGTGIIKAHTAITEAGGDFRLSDLNRSPSASNTARAKYENWLAAGKPSGTQFNSKTMKDAYVARGGHSMHNSGRAMDVHLQALGLPLQELWDILIPLGWTPIIKSPNARASEAWHFNFLGEWAGVYDRLGEKQTAIACCLDIGLDCYSRWETRFIQAQLQRAGYDVGDIDGHTGTRTTAGKAAARLLDTSTLSDYANLPSSVKVIWRG